MQVRREISELAVLEAFIESLPIPTANRKAVAATTTAENSAHQKQATEVLSSEKGKCVICVECVVYMVYVCVFVYSFRHSVLLTKMHSFLYTGDKMSVAEDGGAEGVAEEPEDKSVTRMKSAISAMVSKLKVKIDTTEKVLGDKLKVLDRDGDGQISYDEVKDVIGTVMKRGASTDESVEQLFSLLDSNKDGKVSVAELLHYIHKKKETMEAEVLEVRYVLK